MTKKKKAKRTIPQATQIRFVEKEQSQKSNSLIFSGVVLAISSIGLLIFVLSEKIFHLR